MAVTTKRSSKRRSKLLYQDDSSDASLGTLIQADGDPAMPTHIIQNIFAWIHPRTVLKYSRLSRSIYFAMNDPVFALLNLERFVPITNTDSFQSLPDEFDSLWFRWPRIYQKVYAAWRLYDRTKLDWRGANALRRKIPKAIGFLSNLTYLSLGSCRLIGEIPSQIGRMMSLEHLHLAWNNLSGPIPPEIGNLVHLKYLSLSDNNLDSNIPEEIGNLVSLQVLDLGNNRLDGHIPSTIGGLAQLQKMALQNNRLSGTIPLEIVHLVCLQEINLYENSFERWLIPNSVASDSHLFHVLKGIGFYREGENHWR
ncbi:hypothetical protein HDU79_007616 [Rhizoclosmatium sp. JEL0117]|nr:hypothetical protein HDU79_007616 [Rhizoclosmatium sp. JEL0117]